MADNGDLLEFEWHALRALFSRNGILLPERTRLRLLSRKHTGVGSYTEIEVKGFSSLIPSEKKFFPLHADVEGLANGVTLIIWPETDASILLEAVAHDESMPLAPRIVRFLS